MSSQFVTSPKLGFDAVLVIDPVCPAIVARCLAMFPSIPVHISVQMLGDTVSAEWRMPKSVGLALIGSKYRLFNWYDAVCEAFLRTGIGSMRGATLMIASPEHVATDRLERIAEHFLPDVVVLGGDTLSLSCPWAEVVLPLPQLRATVLGSRALATDFSDALLRPIVAGKASNRIIQVNDLICISGFYSMEVSGSTSWVWTGPSRTSIFFVPVAAQTDYRVKIFVYAAQIPVHQDNLTIVVDNRLVEAEYSQYEISFLARSDADLLEIRINVDSTKPVEDGRSLGIAISSVKIEVVL